MEKVVKMDRDMTKVQNENACKMEKSVYLQCEKLCSCSFMPSLPLLSYFKLSLERQL